MRGGQAPDVQEIIDFFFPGIEEEESHISLIIRHLSLTAETPATKNIHSAPPRQPPAPGSSYSPTAWRPAPAAARQVASMRSLSSGARRQAQITTNLTAKMPWSATN